MNWSEQIILLTGGTGSFGKKFVEIMLREYHPKAIRIFSRDELKQYEMQKTMNHPSLRYFIGDVRDKDRVHSAILEPRAIEDIFHHYTVGGPA